MKELKFKIKGVAPLLMHNSRMANPLDDYAQFIRPLTKKKNKTDADHHEIARIEWEAGLYLRDGTVVMPAANIQACLWEASKRTKNGKKFQAGVMIAEDYFKLEHKGPKIQVNGNGKIPIADLDKYFPLFKDQSLVKVSQARTVRTRPIFYDWNLTMSLFFDESVLDARTIVSILEDAGRFVGLCEKRPRLGRFEVEQL